MMVEHDEVSSASPAAVTDLLICRWSALASAGIGLTVLAGWLVGIPVLKSVLPGLTTMKVNAALCFVAAGAALPLCHAGTRGQLSGTGRALRVSVALAAAVCAVGVLTLMQYASGFSFGIDELILADPNTTSPPYPGRMAPTTALCFACIGLSILLLCHAGRRPASSAAPRYAAAGHLLALVPAGTGYIGLAGYIYGVKGLHSFGPFVSVALNTAVAFVLLSAALLFTLPDLGWRRRFARAPLALAVFRHLLPFSLLVPFAFGAAVVWGARTGVYDPLFGPALFALAIAGSGIGLVWRAVGAVRRAEWMMIDAIESRDRTERRQNLLRRLADHAHATAPHDALANTAALLGHHFDAGRVTYSDVDETGAFIDVAHEFYAPALGPIGGTHCLADYGTDLVGELRAQRTVVVHDVLADPRTRDGTAAHLAVGMRSVVVVPLVQEGRLRATLYVARADVRAWTASDVDIIEGVAGRSWATVERARAEHALQESEARLRATFEAAPVGIMFADAPSGRLVFGNAAVEQIFRNPMRYSAHTEAYDEWRGYHADGRKVQPDEYPLVRTLRTAEPARGDFQFECGDGVRRWISITTAPVRDAAGRMTGAILVCADIDDARRLETLLARGREDLEALVEERTRDLQETQTRLAHMQRMEALGQLAGGIAHDFNNVLQAVQGGASLIERRPADLAGVRRLAGMIVESAVRGSAITRRLLAFSRRGDLRTEAVPPAPLLAGMREILAHTLGAGVVVRVDAPASLPMLLADKGQLETVLVNLATNARDAMEGSGVLTMQAAQEIVEPDRPPGQAASLAAGQYIRLRVTDTGSGMPPDILARATEPFFTTKEPGKGTGLGLAMARGFAEQSGGGLLVQSESGIGTTVTLWFPAAAGAATGQSPPDSLAETRSSAPANLLVVDDDAAVREILAQELEASGYAVVQMAEASAALAFLDRGEPVDLIVSDLSMPGMDGVSLVREAQRRRPKLPAVILTGFATNAAEIAIGGALSGAFTLLRKPVSGTVLAERVAVLLGDVSRGVPAPLDHRRSA